MRPSIRLAALGLAFCGCLREAPVEPIGEAAQPIIGGTTDTGDPGVVLLFAAQPGAASGSLCSAEIVSPHVVLTAAHCVSPDEVGQGAVFHVFTGDNFNQANQANMLAVRETHFDPQFNTNQLDAGHDIGVAILENPVSIAPLVMNRAPLTVAMQGQPVRLVGYGLDDSATQTGAGIKRQTSTTLTDYDQVLVHFSDGQHETCNGDSGGPAFMTFNGQEVIVGLTSFGDQNCNMGGYDTRVDAMVSFVDPYIAANDPAAPPPDLSSPPDMADPGSPDPGRGGTSPTGTALAEGAPCVHDTDCASDACGIGTKGDHVCVSQTAPSNSLLGGCSLSRDGSGAAARDGWAALALVWLLAFAAKFFRRGAGRRAR